MRDLPLLFITNPDVPDTAFNEKALEKASIDDTEEKKFLTQKAQQDEQLATTSHSQLELY